MSSAGWFPLRSYSNGFLYIQTNVFKFPLRGLAITSLFCSFIFPYPQPEIFFMFPHLCVCYVLFS